jgi:hypothetical protein
MRQTIPAVAAGALAAVGLYGLLAVLGGKASGEKDLLAEAWAEAGLQVEFGAHLTNPSKELLFVEGRELFEPPAGAGAVIREYQLDGIRTQLVVLPSPEALPELPEGKHAGFKLRPKGGQVHLCRKGRHVLFLSMRQGTAMFRVMSELVPVNKAFNAFEKAVP